MKTDQGISKDMRLEHTMLFCSWRKCRSKIGGKSHEKIYFYRLTRAVSANRRHLPSLKQLSKVQRNGTYKKLETCRYVEMWSPKRGIKIHFENHTHWNKIRKSKFTLLSETDQWKTRWEWCLMMHTVGRESQYLINFAVFQTLLIPSF